MGMVHLIWFETEANTFQADGDHNKKVGSLGKAEWLDLSKGLEDAPPCYFVVNWSADHFNLRCTRPCPKIQVIRTTQEGCKPRSKHREARRRGGSKIYGVTNYWQQLVLSQLPTTWSFFPPVSRKQFHLLFEIESRIGTWC